MQKNIMIMLVGMQVLNHGETDTMEMMVSGTYYEKNNKQYITYKESQMTNLNNTTTTVKWDGKKVTIIRFGDTQSNMIFELNRKHVTYYDTPNGCFTVSTMAKEIKVDLVQGEGEIHVVYALELDNMSIGVNSFQMTIGDKEDIKKMIPTEYCSEIQMQ